jgi:hypothetical protein
MANNYTVSSLETPTGIIETPGDNVSNSTPTYILTITPDPGYSITHSNFIANSLPSEISSVTFAQNGEIVVATVNFSTNFIMPSNDVNLQIDIDGSAQLKNYTVAGTYSTTETNTTTSSVSNVAYNNNGNYTTTELLFSKTFTASSASGSGFSGYYFEIEPYISFSSMHLFGPRASRYNITTSKVYNSENQLTSKTFNVNYTYPPLDYSADSISFIANAVKIYDEPLEIKSYKIVTKNLSKFGESRSLRIYGSPGSKFDLTITKNSIGDTYDFTNNTFTSTSSYDDDVTIPSLGYYDYDILFPGGNAADNSITQDNTYTIFIEAGTNTALRLQSPLLDKFDIKQLLDKSVTISVSDSGSTGYTISPFTPISGPVGETDPVIEFDNIFTISYSSAITIVGQPLVTDFVSALDVGNTDVAFSDVTLTQGVTNTVNLTIPKSYIYEFGESNVVYNLDIASFISAATNTQPVASSQIASAISAVGKSLTLVGSDAENSPLTFAIASNPSDGTLSNFDSGHGTVVYTSNSGFTGSDSFTFTVNDGDLTSTAATVTLSVAAQSVAPTATDIFSWREGNSGSYTTLLSWTGDVSYTNLTTGSSNIGLSVTNWSLDNIHTGYPNYIDGYEDFDVDYVFKDSNGTVLYSSYLQINTSTSSVDSFGATLNFSNTSILIPGTYNSGNGLISGASYTLEIKLSYNNNSQP